VFTMDPPAEFVEIISSLRKERLISTDAEGRHLLNTYCRLSSICTGCLRQKVCLGRTMNILSTLIPVS
jgi:hypothetical protein